MGQCNHDTYIIALIIICLIPKTCINKSQNYAKPKNISRHDADNQNVMFSVALDNFYIIIIQL